jgi:peroxiredoxin
LKIRILISMGIIAVLAGIYFLARRQAKQGGSTAAVSQNSLAPDFSLIDLDGQNLKLSSYRGKVVILDFWATWCDPCRDEIPHFVEMQNKYRGQGLQIIGVSMDDDPQPVHDFYSKFKMNYPVVMGNAQTGSLYGGILGLPITFVIGGNGRIVAKHIGATENSVFEKEVEDLLPARSAP